MKALLSIAVSMLFAASAYGGMPRDEAGNIIGPSEGIAYDRAVAPYVAKARATFPAAKKRFLAGLPRGSVFSVMIRLWGKPDKSTGKGHAEDIFVDVDSIEGGKLNGRIANTPLIATNYRRGQRVSVSESEIRNWLIQRADGSEEGNFVGKFLDSQSAKQR
jgi:uncharacterized protein YegJ (DUF2314 family)